MKNYGNVMALKEHLLEFNKISLLESQLLFGVQSLPAEIYRLKRDGYIVKSQRVYLSKVLNRINNYTVCKTPKNLPTNEILVTEWWVCKWEDFLINEWEEYF